MVNLIGSLKRVTTRPSEAVEVWVAAPAPRAGSGGGVVLPERERVAVTDGAFEVTLEPGPATLVVVHAGGLGEQIPLLVADGQSTVADAMRAAELADGHTRDQIQELIMQVQGLLNEAGDQASQAAQQAQAAAQAQQLAEQAQAHAEAAQQHSEQARTLAQQARDAAQAAKTGAESAKSGAISAKNQAVSAKDTAVTAKNQAAQSATQAETAKDLARKFASDADQSKGIVRALAQEAETHADRAEQATDGKADIGHTHVSDDISNPTNGLTAGRVVKIDNSGHMVINRATLGAHPARWEQVEAGLSEKADLNHTHTSADITDARASSSGAANKVVLYNNNNNIYIPTPRSNTEAVNKSYADSLGTTSSTPNTIVRRDSSGQVKTRTPSASDDAANKSYVDAAISEVQPLITGVTGRISISSSSIYVYGSGAGSGVNLLTSNGGGLRINRSFKGLILYSEYPNSGYVGVATSNSGSGSACYAYNILDFHAGHYLRKYGSNSGASAIILVIGQPS